MYGYFLILVSVSVFSVSYYIHFMHQHEFDHMVAFVGHDHVRKFENDFRHAHADLWAFGHRKRKSARLRFGLDAFETFQEREYKQMLLLHKLHDIPLLYSDDVIEYKLGNRTVASLWPYLDTWPESGEDALSWYKDSGGHVVTLHL